MFATKINLFHPSLLHNLIKSHRDYVILEFNSVFTELFELVEHDLTTKGKANFTNSSEQTIFNILSGAPSSDEADRQSLGERRVDAVLDVGSLNAVKSGILTRSGK
ncbi:unnamed protein product [Linum trigynum]|uniref:Uncharacterized protein n=1 Tax=Linum trigynum TaxID=586398 RepID=A0AAV2DZE7_9ROSI